MRKIIQIWDAMQFTLFVGIIIALAIPVIAQSSGQSGSSASQTSAQESCQKETKDFLDKETKEYEKFINKHLQSKKSANKLMQTANQRYFQYRAKLLNYKKRIAFLPSIQNPAAAELDVSRCQEVIDKYLLAAAKFQKRSLIGNAQRKHTIRLSERMREINSKLDGLNKNVGNIKAFVQIFVQKVPCYVEKCPPL